ncbi:hypothetical protein [Luteimonas terricola]|uniref:Uncharacterized protein n=1 Tax=Luteimonas terricola TaxID=645597 RepID=A0ABQ2EBL4_9GAMM|nr:hypothetical protein [Luteimonas terricola]GGJ98899.1 hypothetical protein GCM10011394_04940 [Luteimonas terricola]
MRIKLHPAAAVAVALLASTAFAVGAGEHEVRSGVVTAMQPVAARADVVSASTKRQLGGMLGRALGQAVGGRSGQSYELTRVAANLGADIASGDGDGAPGGDYMLMVRFDDASESAFTRTGAQLARIRIGGRVKVVGSGDSAMLVAE